MAKKKETPVKRVSIACPYYKGYLDEMPVEAKEKMRAEKPELYELIFEPKVLDEQ